MVERAGTGSDAADEGVVLRPEVHALDESALVPESNVIRPTPTRFTHELTVDTPFRLDRTPTGSKPDGILPAGTPVVVTTTHGDRCRVVDGRGLAVDVPRDHVQVIRS
jgi:hypothetical protein